MPNPDYTSLLKKKTDLLISYQAATERARDHLDETEIICFAACMKERNRLIHKIVLTDRMLMPEGSYELTTISETAGDPVIRSLFKEVEGLLTQIKSIEDDCIRSAQRYFKTLKGDLLTARENRKGTKGYRPATAASAKFIDTRIR